jgi:hypothetical protein
MLQSATVLYDSGAAKPEPRGSSNDNRQPTLHPDGAAPRILTEADDEACQMRPSASSCCGCPTYARTGVELAGKGMGMSIARQRRRSLVSASRRQRRVRFLRVQRVVMFGWHIPRLLLLFRERVLPPDTGSPCGPHSAYSACR